MQKKNKKGFTIVELVVVIAVIGILSAILIPTFMGLSDNARAKALQSDLASAYTQYAVEAADGVVDDYYSSAQGAEIKIAIKSQDQVVLVKGNEKYHIADTSKNEWVKYEVQNQPTTLVVTTAATHHKNASGTLDEEGKSETALSTFLTYTVYVKAAA